MDRPPIELWRRVSAVLLHKNSERVSKLADKLDRTCCYALELEEKVKRLERFLRTMRRAWALESMLPESVLDEIEQTLGETDPPHLYTSGYVLSDRRM